MAKQKTAGLAKTNSKYWEPKVFKPRFTRNGERLEARSYSARIQYMGKRHTFPLGSSNREAAGKTAAKIYTALLSRGWEATLEEYAPTFAPKEKTSPTLGEFFAEAEVAFSGDPRTVRDYIRSFRRIAADVEKIDSAYTVTRNRDVEGKRVAVEETKDARFDYRGGAGKKWRARVDAVRLSRITPGKVRRWKKEYIDAAGPDQKARKSATVSANSIIRQAKSLFGTELLPHLTETMELPEPLPFEEVKLEKVRTRYRAKVDPRTIMRAAVDELSSHDECFKIFILGITAGLRRGEIDNLLWENVDLDRGVICIETTEHHGPKTEESEDEVELDQETAELLRGYRAKATGPFVVESEREPRAATSYDYIRCADHFAELYDWLRDKGITSQKPLHELRKMFGSVICREFGLYAASRVLRHSNITTTADFYLDRGSRVSFGLGALLEEEEKPENIEEMKKAGNE